MTTHVHALPAFGNERTYVFPTFQGGIELARQGSPVNRTNISGFFASMLLRSGTGANFDMHNIGAWLSYVKGKAPLIGEVATSSIEFATQHEAAPDLRSAEEHLINVRNTIGLPMSELAKELRVTRQALYKWLSGESQPDSPEKFEHIRRLSIVADLFNTSKLSNGKSLVKMRVFDGISLLDIIRTSPDWYEKASAVVTEAVAMREAARASGMMDSKAESSADWLAGESISGAFERNI